ncbi:hypothetical protein V1477_018283, partial [Vespula maculifrons]
MNGGGSLDEANSKRDVLLIILTPGVRLNERRSQTHEAQCKFNYRDEDTTIRKENDDDANNNNKTTKTTTTTTTTMNRPIKGSSNGYRNVVCYAQLANGRQSSDNDTKLGSHRI